MFYPVIMAGGSGTRLWPLSRKKAPKQLCKFFSDKTLVRETYDRISSVYKNIYISINKDYVDIIKEHIKINDKNYIIEPSKRDTSAAICLLSIIINHYDKNASVITLSSDHYIENVQEFQNVVKFSEVLISKYPNKLITIGIKPTYPETGYGYIEICDKIYNDGKYNVYNVSRFKEKPNIDQAQKFISSDRYLWNAGIFIFNTNFILDCYKKFLPNTYENLIKLKKYIDTNKFDEKLNELYNKCEKISFDIAIVEKLKDTIVIPADFGWSDIGNWGAIKNIATKNIDDNYTVGDVICANSKGCLVYNTNNKKIITIIGLENIIIVDSHDALLVMNKDKSHEIKEILNQVPEDKL